MRISGWNPQAQPITLYGPQQAKSFEQPAAHSRNWNSPMGNQAPPECTDAIMRMSRSENLQAALARFVCAFDQWERATPLSAREAGLWERLMDARQALAELEGKG